MCHMTYSFTASVHQSRIAFSASFSSSGEPGPLLVLKISARAPWIYEEKKSYERLKIIQTIMTSPWETYTSVQVYKWNPRHFDLFLMICVWQGMIKRCNSHTLKTGRMSSLPRNLIWAYDIITIYLYLYIIASIIVTSDFYDTGVFRYD